MTLELVLLFAVGVVAFTTEATIGFGATVLAVTLGSHVIPLDRMLPAFVPLNIAMSIVLFARYRRHVAWRVLLVELGPPVGLGAVSGMLLFRMPARGVLQLIFGLLVVGLATLELARLGKPDRPLSTLARRAWLFVGGVAHGLFGTGGPMIVYVLRRLVSDKTAFRATLSVLWLALNAAVVTNLASLALFSEGTAALGITLAAAMVPGFLIGERLHHALEPHRFWRIVCVVLLLAGLSLAIRSALTL